MIIGYGISHDAGIAVVEKDSGKALFAASLERLTRSKNQGGNPQVLLKWAEKTIGRELLNESPLNLRDDTLFHLGNGFHGYESGLDYVYRWTAEQAVIPIDPNTDCQAVVIGIIPASSAMRKLTADVFLNGIRTGSIDNRKSFWKFTAPAEAGPIREVRIHAQQTIVVDPDPRTLGIPVTAVYMISQSRTHLSGSAINVISELPAGENLKRLLHKQFWILPRLSLRGHNPRRLLKYLYQNRFFIGSSYRYESKSLMGADTAGTISSRYDHHLCHAAGAYYPSGFNRALVVTLDGMGDWYSCRVMRGENGVLTPLAEYYFEQLPIGINYEIVTTMLGFNRLRHAGKITGLAAYGKDNPDCDAGLDGLFRRVWRRDTPGGTEYETLFFTGDYGISRLIDLRQKEFGQFSREDISYSIQKRTEQEVVELITGFMSANPDLQDIALAGGVFANVRVNQKVRELGFRQIFVQPAMSDAGLCYGAALLECARRANGRLLPFRLEHVYLGPEFDNETIRQVLDEHGLESEFVAEEHIGKAIAQHIAEKRVVAHFHGRMEFGPRALGNRSILYSAADPDVNRWLNEQLNRTEFMPFAPAILAERAGEYFDDIEGAEHAAEFMTITMNCTERAGREIPAAIHVDNTARPQFVQQSTNPRFHAVLSAYAELTNVPCVINTSFNMHEEPIVATPEDAIRSFLQGRLDILAIGNYIVRQPMDK